MVTLHTRSRVARFAVALAGLLLSASCASEFTRTGQSPAYLVIDALSAASGAKPDAFGNPLNSDVVTILERNVLGQNVRVATVYNDLGRVSMHVALKNIVASTSPSPTNQITLTRYRVTFRRADGRNTPGVDVPHGFDGGITATVGAQPTTAGFELVRFQTKGEPPVSKLAGGGGSVIISTLAEITFYGHDQAGNEVSVVGTITVNFGDFADPA